MVSTEVKDEDVKKDALSLAEKAKAVVVRTPEEAANAVEFGKACKSLRIRIVEFYKPLKKAFDDGKRVVLDREKDALAPVDLAESLISSAVTKYRVEQDRIAREARVAEEKRQRDEAEKKRLAAIDHALKKGNEAQAERLLEKPLPAPIVKTVEPPKIAGIRRRQVWKFEIIDSAKIPREFLCVDEKAIGAFVRAKKEEAKIEGVRIYSEDETDF